MYLVSLYFDDKASRKIQGLINKIAARSGNNFMIDGNVPPHITIASFQTNEESRVIEVLDEKIKNIKSGNITFASVGAFKSSVIYLAPILNEYLHNLSVSINEGISSLENISISKYYLPFQWIPHATIGKKLDDEQLLMAFQELVKEFTIFNGTVTRIGLSKTNPLRDVAVWKLDDRYKDHVT
ncbi:MAG: 2'-5' RNA ligase family protein [Clostridium sp.]|nr:2'-5' RNA ligase family protein [Clostridium sp.]